MERIMLKSELLEEVPLKSKVVSTLLEGSDRLLAETQTSSFIALVSESHDALLVFKTRQNGKEVDLVTIVNSSLYSISELLLSAQAFIQENYYLNLSLLGSQSASDSSFLKRNGYRFCLCVDEVNVFLKKIH